MKEFQDLFTQEGTKEQETASQEATEYRPEHGTTIDQRWPNHWKKALKTGLLIGALGASYLLGGLRTGTQYETMTTVHDSPTATQENELLLADLKELSLDYVLLREQRDRLLDGEMEKPKAPEAIDTLDMPLGSYIIEIDKEEQVFRVWERSNYRLAAETPCTTGKNPGEKERRGDSKTPGGYFTIISEEQSTNWSFEGRHAYGPYFFRMNYGSWDGNADYDPKGHCSLGIHGTDRPEMLGTRDSHGCTRLSNDFLLQARSAGYLERGNVGYVTPEEPEALLMSKAGIGTERIRNRSGKNR